MLLQANHPKAFPSQRMLTTGESGRLVHLSVCVTFLFNSLPNFHVVQKTFQIFQVWQCLGFVQLIQDQKTIIKLHKVPQHTFVWDFSHDLHNTTLNSIMALAVLVCIIVVVVLLLTAELLPVALEAVESVLERVALLALHPRVQDQAAILKITFTLCYTLQGDPSPQVRGSVALSLGCSLVCGPLLQLATAPAGQGNSPK